MSAMANWFWRTRLLVLLVIDGARGGYEHWSSCIRGRDPDEPACCAGDPMFDMCGCEGATLREVYPPRRPAQ